jgi:transposase InsO family protein
LSKVEKNYSHLDKEALGIIYGVKRLHQYLHGRPFEIKTDHKPLTYIFSESRATPTMASGRIQRWALTLGGYDYSIQFKEGKSIANADALSRLPLQTSPAEVPRPPELVHLMEHLDSTPLSCTQIRIWTDHDPILSRVRKWVQKGWPAQDQEDKQDLQPYYHRREELSTEGGCVLWGNRVVVPEKGRKRALDLLHEAHPGIVRMKSLARGYMWWPRMDKQIELCVKECTICQASRKMPPAAPLHPWARPEKPWSRVHIDYAGPLEGKMFLLIIDAHSKWLEIHATSSSTSTATIELLRKSFASLGLPEVIVSDNATAFTSEEFAEFLKRNGIRHVRTPPYHPASNGLVERAVQTFKEGMKRLQSGTLSTRLSRFLLRYRITPHSSTGSTPAELMWGRTLRSQLDLLLPDMDRKMQQTLDCQRRSHDARSTERRFDLNDTVYARNYGPGPLWLPGLVIGQQGSVMYEIRLNDNREIRRHVDQLRPRVSTGESDASITDTTDSAVQDMAVGGGAVTETTEPETTEVAQNSSEATPPLLAEATRSTDLPTDAPVVGSSQADESQEQPVHESTESPVRRSAHERHPPVRFEEQCYVIN